MRAIRYKSWIITRDFENLPQDKYLLDTFNLDDCYAESAVLSKEVNRADSFKIRVLKNNPLVKHMLGDKDVYVYVQAELYEINDITLEKTKITYDNEAIFYGRVANITVDMYGNVDIECDGSFSFLNDLAAKVNDYKYKQGDQFIRSAVAFGYDRVMVPDIDYVNDPVGTNKYITCTPQMTEKTVFFEKIDDDSSATAIGDMIVDKCCGDAMGYFVMKYWFGDITTSRGPVVKQVHNNLYYYCLPVNPPSAIIDTDPYFELGKNVIQFSITNDKTNLYTGIYPIGKDNIMLVKDGSNNANRYIWSAKQGAAYDKRARILNLSNLSKASQLRSRGEAWLNAKGSRVVKTVEITGPEPFLTYQGNRLVEIMKPLPYILGDIDSEYNLYCTSESIDLINPESSKFTISEYYPDGYFDDAKTGSQARFELNY